MLTNRSILQAEKEEQFTDSAKRKTGGSRWGSGGVPLQAPGGAGARKWTRCGHTFAMLAREKSDVFV